MADNLTDQQIEDLREAFNLFDRTQDGTIDSKDLLAAMKALGQNPSEEETRILISQNDTDGTGTIDFPEFLSLIAKRQKESLESEVFFLNLKQSFEKSKAPFFVFKDALKDAFNCFDKDGSGLLDRDAFNASLRAMGEGLSEEQLEKMMAAMPYDDEGKLGYEEFVQFILNKKE